MANCTYCGKSAGWFSTFHESCRQESERTAAREREESRAAAIQAAAAQQEVATANEHAAQQIAEVFKAVAGGSLSVDVAEQRVHDLGITMAVDAAGKRKVLANAWKRAAALAIEDGHLSADEDRHLAMLMLRFGLTHHELDQDGALTDMARVKVLQALVDGQVPKVLDLEPGFPVMLQSDESPVWIFNRCELIEHRTATLVAPNAAPRQLASHVSIDTGFALLTTRAVYFVGTSRSAQLLLAKIISVVLDGDTVVIGKGAATAKPLMLRSAEATALRQMLIGCVQAFGKKR